MALQILLTIMKFMNEKKKKFIFMKSKFKDHFEEVYS